MSVLEVGDSGKDPYQLALCKVDGALTGILEITRLLNDNPGVEDLAHVAKYLRELAKQLRAGNRGAGIRVGLVDRKIAAKIMGGSVSAKKLEQLAKAREVRARKRQEEREYKMIRGRTRRAV
ncbi:MAG: hypothetical protein WC661_02070 [Opitutaceae bacterium]|jgi:hypothetical protein